MTSSAATQTMPGATAVQAGDAVEDLIGEVAALVRTLTRTSDAELDTFATMEAVPAVQRLWQGWTVVSALLHDIRHEAATSESGSYQHRHGVLLRHDTTGAWVGFEILQEHGYNSTPSRGWDMSSAESRVFAAACMTQGHNRGFSGDTLQVLVASAAETIATDDFFTFPEMQRAMRLVRQVLALDAAAVATLIGGPGGAQAAGEVEAVQVMAALGGFESVVARMELDRCF